MKLRDSRGKKKVIYKLPQLTKNWLPIMTNFKHNFLRIKICNYSRAVNSSLVHQRKKIQSISGWNERIFTFIQWKFLFRQDLRYIECYSRLENPEWNLCWRKGLVHKKLVVKSLSTLILCVFNWLSLIFSLPLYRVIKNAVCEEKIIL